MSFLFLLIFLNLNIILNKINNYDNFLKFYLQKIIKLIIILFDFK